MSRFISYKCNRCGKPMSSKVAVKINVSMQKGDDPSEKKIYDFCFPCFLSIKSAFDQALIIPKEQADNAAYISTENKTDHETADDTNRPNDKTDSIPDEAPDKASPVPDADADSNDTSGTENEPGLVTGPISQKEHDEILRLFVVEKLSPEEIAKRMNRIPKGVKRLINSASRTGEISRLQNSLDMNEDDAEENDPESKHDSDVSDASISKDSYTVPPTKEYIDGKAYDVGCIRALLHAGWPPEEIAKEKNYDKDVVRAMIEKYHL